jgi:hypothetical protein
MWNLGQNLGGGAGAVVELQAEGSSRRRGIASRAVAGARPSISGHARPLINDAQTRSGLSCAARSQDHRLYVQHQQKGGGSCITHLSTTRCLGSNVSSVSGRRR